MTVKTNLHFHTADDPHDRVPYSFDQGMDAAAKNGFSAVALTLHNKFGYSKEYADRARQRGVFLLPGIEISINKKHVLILNCNNEAESIRTFDDIREYKKRYPGAFVIAPHPYFLFSICLRKELEKNIDIFDAIEFSWLYSKFINFNIKAAEIAKKHHLPLIATSDTHFLEYIDFGSCTIDVGSEIATESIIAAIKNGSFKNETRGVSSLEIPYILAKYEILL